MAIGSAGHRLPLHQHSHSGNRMVRTICVQKKPHASIIRSFFAHGCPLYPGKIGLIEFPPNGIVP